LGLLEKHKDYKQRAVNYHKKEKRLTALKEKAGMRNPDEFYFGMNNAEVKDGKHRSTDKKHMEDNAATLGPEAVRVMKTQDLKYLRAAIERERKKGGRMKAGLQSVGVGGGKKTLFREREEEAGEDWGEERGEGGGEEEEEEGYDEEYDLDIEGLKAGQKKVLTEREEKKAKRKERKAGEMLTKEKVKAYAEMNAREARRVELEKVLKVMELERNLQGGGRKRKVGEGKDGVGVFKWRRQRKR